MMTLLVLKLDLKCAFMYGGGKFSHKVRVGTL